MKPWVASLFSLAIAFSAAAVAEVKGKVSFVDGEPIHDANVVVRDLYGGSGGMPDVRILAVLTTDKNGIFSVPTRRLKGALHFRLLPDKCNWSGDVRVISKKELAKGKVFIVMNPRRINCVPKK